MKVGYFIAEQGKPKKEIMTILRSWILDLGPHVQEKISNKIPSFSFYGVLCFLNPTLEGVDLGFSKGYELEDETRILESKGRKQVRSITFFSVTELEEQERVIRHLLNEAAILNEYRFKRKAGKKK